MSVFPVFFGTLIFCLPALCSVVNVEIISVGNSVYPNFPGAYAFTGPGIETGVEEINRRYSKIFKFTHLYLNDKGIKTCLELAAESDNIFGKWFYADHGGRPAANLTVFLLGGCGDSVYLANRLASAWNILMITSVSNDPILRNKRVSPTWISTACVSLKNYLTLFPNVLRFFNWTSVTLFFDVTANGFFHILFPNLVETINSKVVDSQLTVIRINSSKETNYSAILQDAGKISRGKLLTSTRKSCNVTTFAALVIILLGHGGTLRKLMLSAANENMTNGEFVYMALEPFSNRMFGNFTWKYGDGDDEKAKQAYRAVLLLRPSDEIYAAPTAELVQEWKKRSLINNNVSYDEPNPIVMASYSSVTVLALVLKEILTNEPMLDLKDGKSLAKRFLNRTVNLGFASIYIDEVGERRTVLTVHDLNLTTERFEPALFQDAEMSRIHLLQDIDWGSDLHTGPPPNRPICGFQDPHLDCLKHSENLKNVADVLSGTLCTIFMLSIIAGFFIRRYYMKKADLDRLWWHINLEDVGLCSSFIQDKPAVRVSAMRSNEPEFSPIDGNISNKQKRRRKLEYRGSDVWTEQLPTSDKTTTLRLAENGKLVGCLKQLREITHNNLNKFVGLCILPASGDIVLISQFCARGSLHDVFVTLSLDWDLQYSLISDLIEGMNYIHSSAFKFHGSLTEYLCLVDHHFSLKISELGYSQLRGILSQRMLKIFSSQCAIARTSFWTAPEVLRGDCSPNQLSDVFAVGALMYQIISVVEPQDNLKAYTDIHLRKNSAVKSGNELDRDSVSASNDLDQLIRACCNENVAERPSIMTVKTNFIKSLDALSMSYRKAPLVERIIQRLDKHAVYLEEEILNRTASLIEERNKCDDLLMEMLPKQIVDKLRNGTRVDAELFDAVTVLFSGLHGFASFVSTSVSASATTDLLDTSYTLLDPVLKHFDVYKVETIGDTYMVASGIPVPNGDEHAKEICGLAFSFHRVFEMHRVTVSCLASITLQTGIHTGACAAGVVGHRKPRYCLFGDTVNTASRMASYSASSQIHATTTTVKLILQFPEFVSVPRGGVTMKGKDEMKTFWLHYAYT